MARHFNEEPKASEDKRLNDLPPLEDGNTDDETIASPALGYGMERVDFLDSRSNLPANEPYSVPTQTETDDYQEAINTLAHNEVAAVSANRPYYVSDVPSPYLSTRQAQEDVQVTRKRHSRISAIITILLLVAILGVGGWFLWNAMKSEPKAKVAQYETRIIEKGEYLEAIDTTSLVRPADEAVVTPNVSGTVAEVYVEDNTEVQQGDLLMRLDNQTISDAVRKAEDALNTFQAEVDKKQESLNKANEAVTKAQEAVAKDEKSEAAKKALEQAKTAATKAQEELDKANNDLWSMQSTYNSALEQLETLNVYAPISGTLSGLSGEATPSGTVSASTRLCTITDTSHYSLVMEIPKSEANRVDIGQEVRISFPAIEDLHITSSVDSLDDNGETLLATVLIKDPDERITTGIAAEASLILESIPDTLIVPANAVHTAEDGTTYVDVLLDPTRGIKTDIQVKVLAIDGEKAAVDADNIQADTAVVVSQPEENGTSSE